MGPPRLLYANDATLLLPRHCYCTAMLILPRRCYRSADATLLPLPHCRCGHTAAATLRLLHLTASCEAAGEPPGLREPPALLRGGYKRALTLG